MKYLRKPLPVRNEYVEAIQIAPPEAPDNENPELIRSLFELFGDNVTQNAQRHHCFIVHERERTRSAQPGDWIVRHENGDLEVLTGEEFIERYDEAGKQALERTESKTFDAAREREDALAAEVQVLREPSAFDKLKHGLGFGEQTVPEHAPTAAPKVEVLA